MPTTTEEILGFLDAKEVKYLYDARKETFVICFTPHVLLIRIEENGEFLQFRTLNFYQYKNGKHRELILAMIAAMNYRRKLVKFGYDEADGEINACVDIPVEDGTLTSTQFFRCMAALLEALEESRSRITAVLETGKDPGPGSSKIIDRLVGEIMDSLDEKKQGNLDKPKEQKKEPEEDKPKSD